MEDTKNSNDLKKSNIKSLSLLAKYMRPYKWSLFGVAVAILLTSSSVLGIGQGLAYLIDQGFHSQNTGLLNNSLFILLSITVLLALATFVRFFLITYTGERVVADLRRDAYQHIIKLSPSFFEVTKAGDIMARLVTDTEIIQTVVGSSLSIAARNTIMLIGGLVMLIATSPKLTLYVIIIVPLVLLPIILLGRKVRVYSKQSQEKVAILSSHIEETVNGVRTIQSYVRENVENHIFIQQTNDILAAAKKRISLRSYLTAIVIIIIFGSIGFVLWVGGHDVLDGTITAGQLSSFVFYSVLVAGSTGALSEVAGNIQRAAGAAERIFEIMRIKSDIVESSSPATLPSDFKGAITFSNVNFNYPTRPNDLALKDFYLKINAGETVAIVGQSGAGKSTIINILLRFYNIKSGTIYLDGVDISSLPLKELRSQFGLVPQDSVIFSTTIRDNISYGNLEASEEDIILAAESACAMEFINNTPNGLDTHIGEKGIRLSGGQKQRITIARAILKNPKILLLDEATSSLDTKNETLVQNALEILMQNRTTIVIAHRLSTVQKADKIIVLEHGALAAIGTHQELLESSELYSKLAYLQFTD
jgi:ATP-binding cassette subfamily B protein